VQLYIQDAEASVPRPIKELKGFKKVFLEPGETAQVEINLSAKDFSYWDINKKAWYAEPGEFKIMAGASSDDIKETSTIILD
jgi:beta-glucosidase